MKKKVLEATRAYKLVTAVVVAAYIATCIQTVVLMTSVYSMGVGMSWVAWYIAGQLLPGLVFAAIWFLARGLRWERSYQAAMLAIAATFFTSVFSTLLMFASQFMVMTYDSFLSIAFYNWLPIAIQLLVTVLAVVWIRRQKNVEQSLQWSSKVVTWAFFAFFLVNILQTAFMVAVQYPDNQNLSGYVTSFIGFGVVALFFIVTYLLEKRRKATHSMQSAVVVTTMGMMSVYAVVDLMSLSISSTITNPWVVAGIVTVCSLLVIFGYRWLYRTLRVLV